MEHDLANSGDYVTTDVGRAPIVVVRDRDGQLRAFHNLCRHRGLPVVTDQGNCGRGMVCPYHRWNYGLNGDLRAVPQGDQFEDLDRAQLGLKPVRCETWNSLVFVHLDSEAPALTEWLGDFGSTLDGFHLASLQEVSTQVHQVRANWKLYVENHVDWLHLWYVHADTLSAYSHSEGERRTFGKHWISFEPSTDASASRGSDHPPGMGDLPGLSEQEQRLGAHFIFPGVVMFTNRDHVVVGGLTPKSPDELHIELRVFALEDADGESFAEAALNPVMYEDYAIAESIQSALASPAYGVGPLAADYEAEIARFHKNYLEYVHLVP